MITDETRKKWRDKIRAILKAEDEGEITLTDWEVGFIDTVYATTDDDRDLSFKQAKCLNRIYERIS